jgi:hypothetical protein
LLSLINEANGLKRGCFASSTIARSVSHTSAQLNKGGDSPTSWNKIDSEVVMIAPAARSLSRAIGISCLLQEETPSARTYTETPVSRRESVVWSTQTCD